MMETKGEARTEGATHNKRHKTYIILIQNKSNYSLTGDVITTLNHNT